MDLISLFIFIMAIILALLNNYKTNKESFLDNKDWKIDVDNTNNLVFKFKDKNVAQISKHGELTSTRCKCGQWNIRDSRIGIPGRNDMNMHSDGWVRLLGYNSPEFSLGKHTDKDFVKGGWAAKELLYHKSGGGRVHHP